MNVPDSCMKYGFTFFCYLYYNNTEDREAWT